MCQFRIQHAACINILDTYETHAALLGFAVEVSLINSNIDYISKL